MLQSLLCLLGRLKLNVGVAFGQVRVDTVHGHVDHLDLAVDGEDLLDVVLDDISGQPAQVDLCWLGRGGASAASISVVLLGRLRLGPRAPSVMALSGGAG